MTPIIGASPHRQRWRRRPFCRPARGRCLGVHLCPVVAAVTEQSTVAVTQVQPMPTELLDAQLAALATDMYARVIRPGCWATPPTRGGGPLVSIGCGGAHRSSW